MLNAPTNFCVAQVKRKSSQPKEPDNDDKIQIDERSRPYGVLLIHLLITVWGDDLHLHLFFFSFIKVSSGP
jgi:hypothetical protein